MERGQKSRIRESWGWGGNSELDMQIEIGKRNEKAPDEDGERHSSEGVLILVPH
jgi:hypothetical protein